MRFIRVAVIEGLPIFRRGLVGCLAVDPIVVVWEADWGLPATETDVVVCSDVVADHMHFTSPLVVCGGTTGASASFGDNMVAAYLVRSTLEPQQLVAAVQAAHAGLTVSTTKLAGLIDDRSLKVLRLLASGACTREISSELGYSERTIKTVIAQTEQDLGARSRAEAVATAIRQGLI